MSQATLVYGVGVLGAALSTVSSLGSPAACLAACHRTPGCRGWTYTGQGGDPWTRGLCHLK